jgi:hypothetical protein
MLKQICLLAAAATSLVGGSFANAATISGSTGSAGTFLVYTAYDLSTGTTDWAAFGGLGQGGAASDFTYKQGASSFSPLTVVQGTGYTSGLSGVIKFAYGPAGGTYATATGVSSVDVNPAVADKGGGGSQLSFTHSMLGTAETLQVFIYSKADESNVVDVQATIAGSPAYAQTLTLPTAYVNKGNYGIVSVNVADATIGETLTFSVTGNYAGLSPAGWWGIGLAGATATAVPEPATIGLLASSAALLIRRRRR